MSSTTSPILSFAIRGTQALFAIVVFGLSTTLIRGHKFDSLPSSLGFVSFVGALSFIAALLGIASYWIQVLQGHIGVLIDTAIVGVNIAGGILLAIKLKGIRCVDQSCSNDWEVMANCAKLMHSDILCGNKGKAKGNDCYYWAVGAMNTLLSRCKMSQADSVFMFLTAIVAAAAAWFGWMRLKRGY